MRRPGLGRLALGCAVSVMAAVPLAVFGGAGPAGAAGTYTIVDIGALTGASGTSIATAISSTGDVAGESPSATNIDDEAVLFKNGTLTDEGGLTSDNTQIVIGVNDSDVAVGWDVGLTHAAEYSGGVATDINPTGATGSIADAINDSGEIVGTAQFPSGSKAVTMSVGGAWTDLGHIAGDPPGGAALDVSNSGVAVGDSFDSAGDAVPVVFSGGAATALPTLPNTTNDGVGAISDTGGYIVGSAVNSAGLDHAVQFGPGPSAVDLGVLPGDTQSFANNVNSSDVAVGESSTAGFTSVSAVMFAGGVVTDLNTLLPTGSGWTLRTATDINDAGQIVGVGTHNGVIRGFLLSPPPPPPVPCATPNGPVSGLLSSIPVIGPLLAGLVCQLGLALKLNL
jgi:uncharacterized membrane protein